MASHSYTHLYSHHLEDRGKRISEFRVNLVYKASSRTSSTTQRILVLKTKNKYQNKQKTPLLRSMLEKVNLYVKNIFCREKEVN